MKKINQLKIIMTLTIIFYQSKITEIPRNSSIYFLILPQFWTAEFRIPHFICSEEVPDFSVPHTELLFVEICGSLIYFLKK